MKLNVGCGQDYKQDYKNIDISKEVEADEYYDIIKGIKEKDNSIDEILVGCVIEQIDSNKDFIFVMNEFHRVLKKDGLLWGYVPSTDPNVFYIDPIDKRFFTEHMFNYFDYKKQHYQKFGKTYGFKPWIIKEVKTAKNGIIHFIMQPNK